MRGFCLAMLARRERIKQFVLLLVITFFLFFLRDADSRGTMCPFCVTIHIKKKKKKKKKLVISSADKTMHGCRKGDGEQLERLMGCTDDQYLFHSISLAFMLKCEDW